MSKILDKLFPWRVVRREVKELRRVIDEVLLLVSTTFHSSMDISESLLEYCEDLENALEEAGIPVPERKSKVIPFKQ